MELQKRFGQQSAVFILPVGIVGNLCILYDQRTRCAVSPFAHGPLTSAVQRPAAQTLFQRRAQKRQVPVPVFQQILKREISAAFIIKRYAVADVLLFDLVKKNDVFVKLQGCLNPFGPGVYSGQDQALDAFPAQQLDALQLLRIAAVGAAENGVEPPFPAGRLNAGNQLCVKGVGKAGNNDADILAPSVFQRLSECIRDIVHFFRCLQDRRAELFADRIVCAVQNARNCCG